MTHKEFLINEAAKLLKQGLNPIAVDGHKRAVAAWKIFNEDTITLNAITQQINSSKAEGIAVICGAVSGNLEVIDFDLKNDTSGDLMQRYEDLIPVELLKRLRIVQTRSGGFHYYYKCEVIANNQKLASRPATAAELKDTPTQKQLVIIETRANGGYVVAPPSLGYTTKQDIEAPVISVDERDILLNAARSFNEIYIEQRATFTTTKSTFIKSPFDDYNDKTYLVDLLTATGWTIDERTSNSNKVYLLRAGNSTAANSANYDVNKKLLYVWSTSTEFTPEKAYSAAAVYTVLNHSGDFSASAKQLIKDGFGVLLTKEAAAIAEVEGVEDFEIEGKFWTVELKKGVYVVDIVLTKLSNFIHEVGGFTGFKYNAETQNVLVQQKDGFVKEVGLYEIKQFLKNKIMSNWLPVTFDKIDQEQLLEAVYKKYLPFLNANFMDFLSVTPFEFLRDTKDAAYFPFKNGIVEVTKDGGQFHKYGEFNKVIWAAQMIDSNIEVVKDFANTLDLNNIDFSKFLYKVCNDNHDKYEYFISTIGYLLHKYKDPKAAFAIILAEETENEAEGGGTGKGLFVNAIKELIKTETFDGKQFAPSKSFAFQRVSLDTKIIAIEDIKRGFKFEEMYSFITEGLPVEKKNQKEFFIPFSDSPKITISTNYVVSDEGNHAKRRQKVLEFGNYFSPTRTPFDIYNKMFFIGWDKEEYNRFYNFMFWCTQVYLEGGILEIDKSDSYNIKSIKLKYGEDLLFWFQSKIEEIPTDETVSALYDSFISTYGINIKDYSKIRFNLGVKYLAKSLNCTIAETVQKINGKTQRFIKVSRN